MSGRDAGPPGGVALLSGGLDSTVALAMARDFCEPRWALFIDYGQHARLREEAAARAIAERFGLSFARIDIGWLGELSASALIAGKGEPPDEPRGGGSDAREASRAVWVENRNNVFIHIAAAAAAAKGCRVVIVGFNREEAESFPDNGEAFLAAVNESLAIGAGAPVRVESPTIGLVKREIVARGIALGVPWPLLWSCYRGGALMCGSCESCGRLRRAVAGTSVEGKITFAGR